MSFASATITNSPLLASSLRSRLPARPSVATGEGLFNAIELGSLTLDTVEVRHNYLGSRELGEATFYHDALIGGVDALSLDLEV
jgi:hypothetical protein